MLRWSLFWVRPCPATKLLLVPAQPSRAQPAGRALHYLTQLMVNSLGGPGPAGVLGLTPSIQAWTSLLGRLSSPLPPPAEPRPSGGRGGESALPLTQKTARLCSAQTSGMPAPGTRCTTAPRSKPWCRGALTRQALRLIEICQHCMGARCDCVDWISAPGRMAKIGLHSIPAQCHVTEVTLRASDFYRSVRDD